MWNLLGWEMQRDSRVARAVAVADESNARSQKPLVRKFAAACGVMETGACWLKAAPCRTYFRGFAANILNGGRFAGGPSQAAHLGCYRACHDWSAPWAAPETRQEVSVQFAHEKKRPGVWEAGFRRGAVQGSGIRVSVTCGEGRNGSNRRRVGVRKIHASAICRASDCRRNVERKGSSRGRPSWRIIRGPAEKRSAIEYAGVFQEPVKIKLCHVRDDERISRRGLGCIVRKIDAAWRPAHAKGVGGSAPKVGMDKDGVETDTRHGSSGGPSLPQRIRDAARRWLLEPAAS